MKNKIDYAFFKDQNNTLEQLKQADLSSADIIESTIPIVWFSNQSAWGHSVDDELSLLACAVMFGREDMAAYLLEKGAKPDSISKKLSIPTILMAADYKEFQLLVTAKANFLQVLDWIFTAGIYGLVRPAVIIKTKLFLKRLLQYFGHDLTIASTITPYVSNIELLCDAELKSLTDEILTTSKAFSTSMIRSLFESKKNLVRRKFFK